MKCAPRRRREGNGGTEQAFDFTYTSQGELVIRPESVWFKQASYSADTLPEFQGDLALLLTLFFNA